MRIAVLGCGLMGRLAVEDLVRYSDARITVADARADAAGALAALGPGRIEPAPVDAADPQQVAAVLRGADAVVNCVQYTWNLRVMEGALLARVPYVDLGGLFHMTRRQLELHDRFAAAGVAAVLGLGTSPGIPNLQAAHAMGGLDAVASIRVYDGILPPPRRSFRWPYSIATILDEMTTAPVVFEDGAFQDRAPLSGEEEYTFPDPLGRQSVHLSLHSEIATLPLSYASRGIREASFKINGFGLPKDIFAFLGTAVAIGLFAAEPLAESGHRVTPREVVTPLLTRLEGAVDPLFVPYKAIVTEVRGTRGGAPAAVRVTTSASGEGSRGMTGSMAALGALWLATGAVPPGVHAPEQVLDPERAWSELARRGIQTEIVALGTS